MFRSIADNPVLLIVLLLIIVVIFGANKLPTAARSLGKSARIFKSEVDAMKDDDERRTQSHPRQVEGDVIDAEVDDARESRPNLDKPNS